MAAFLRRRGGRGLSLAEIMIALAIFATGLIMLLGVFPTAARAAEQSQDALLGHQLAVQRLETTRAKSWSAIASDTAQVATTVTTVNNGQSSDKTYQSMVQVTEPQAGLKLVNVTVQWQTDGMTKTATMETYVAQNE